MEYKKKQKTNEDRIERIYELCETHFGDVKFVGVKLQNKLGWIAKAQFSTNTNFSSLTAEGETPEMALKKLKNRVKKIIKRYNSV
jgi:CRISPR/Cas system-associated endoribonuclease Cas2